MYRRYDSTIIKLELLISLLTFVCIIIVVLVIPDYMRAQKCTEHTYAVVTSCSENKVGEAVTSYDYTLTVANRNYRRTIEINNYYKQLYVGDKILVWHTPDRLLWRLPNLFY